MPLSRSPMRLDTELTLAAAAVAPTMSRSVADQITHWARIGRELESSPDVSPSRVQDVLKGARRYDDLPPLEQAIVRAAWNERMGQRRAGLRLDVKFASRGV